MEIREIHLALRQPTNESPIERIRRLQEEARQVVNLEVGELVRTLNRAAELAGSILDAGDACGPGVREACRGAHEDLRRKAQMFAGLEIRAGALRGQ